MMLGQIIDGKELILALYSQAFGLRLGGMKYPGIWNGWNAPCIIRGKAFVYEDSGRQSNMLHLRMLNGLYMHLAGG
jgi:hypothetical protein